MHPAASVILFTVTSGMGYGLLILLALLGVTGAVPPQPAFGLAGFGCALALITAGLLASTFHLGHPERAWRALGQWRSSWLSREGVLAIVTYVPAVLLAAGWVLAGRRDGVFAVMGWLTVVLALTTVLCTAMIYASLKPIAQWRNRWVPAGYLTMALATGALWLALLASLFDLGRGLASAIAVPALLAAAGVKWAYWRDIDGAAPLARVADATGLGALGQARLLERPHTEANYLQRRWAFAWRASTSGACGVWYCWSVSACRRCWCCWRRRCRRWRAVRWWRWRCWPASWGHWSSAGCSSPRHSTRSTSTMAPTRLESQSPRWTPKVSP